MFSWFDTVTATRFMMVVGLFDPHGIMAAIYP
jgi:hypothetical protein